MMRRRSLLLHALRPTTEEPLWQPHLTQGPARPAAHAAGQPDRGVAAAPLGDMAEQLSLPGFDATAPPVRPEAVSNRGGNLLGYALFLAIFPQPADARRIARAAADLRAEHGLSGTPLPPGWLHISLHAIAGFIDTISQSVADAAMAAATSVACSPLPIVFDRVLSFSDSNAFVLRRSGLNRQLNPLGCVRRTLALKGVALGARCELRFKVCLTAEDAHP